jgi:hypothetical protein
MATEIVIIRTVAALAFLIAFILSVDVYNRTKKRTNIWLLISIALVIATVESTMNALQWAEIAKETVDAIGEYLIIAFSLVWAYIAFKFVSVASSKRS